jgi:hypothetical protein
VQFGYWKAPGETPCRQEQGSNQRSASVRTRKDVGALSGHAASPTTSTQPQLGTHRPPVQCTPPPDMHLFPYDSTVLHKYDQPATVKALRVGGDACIKCRAQQMALRRKRCYFDGIIYKQNTGLQTRTCASVFELYYQTTTSDNRFSSTTRVTLAVTWLFRTNSCYRNASARRIRLRMISGFRREGDQNCALLGCYAASGGNFLPTCRDNLWVPSSD